MKKIALAGTFRSGKSTLLKSIDGYGLRDVSVISEVARQMLEQNRSLEKVPEFQDILFRTQKESELEASASNKPIVLCDRGVVDIIVYSSYFGHEVKPEWMNWVSTYDKIFLLDKNDVPFTSEIAAQDPQYAPGRDWVAFRDAIHERFLLILNKLNLPYELLGGTLQKRTARLLDEINIYRGIEALTNVRERKS